MIVNGKINLLQNFRSLRAARFTNTLIFNTDITLQNITPIPQGSSTQNLLRFLGNKLKRFYISPTAFFSKLKEIKSEIPLEEIELKISYVNLTIDLASSINQQALVEKLERERTRLTRETVLSVKGFQYVSQEDVVKFYDESLEGVKLDWIDNFTRPIPRKVSKNIAKALDLKVGETFIFDNIVIMHYDPEGRNSSLTKQQIEDKKDPIAFGVMSCSDRLYYIDDWVDEHCDLTLDKFLLTIGKEEAGTIENTITQVNKLL